MGGRAHVIVHGGSHQLLDRAEARLRELESRWSRFRDSSDVTRANRAAGLPVPVHGDTLAVVTRALDGWRQTEGRFDITTLAAQVTFGYTHSAVDRSPAPEVPGARIGLSAKVQIDRESSTLTVPATTAIDLGGIGKGFAADIVAHELLADGASGALVNVGGDLAVRGTPSDDRSWYLGIEDPRRPPHHVALLRLQAGGVATSGTTLRRWNRTDGSSAHHLIDPARGTPSAAGTVTATVLAADAATAEVFATAAMMLPGADAMRMLESVRLAGLAVDRDGHVFETTTLDDFRA